MTDDIVKRLWERADWRVDRMIQEAAAEIKSQRLENERLEAEVQRLREQVAMWEGEA